MNQILHDLKTNGYKSRWFISLLALALILLSTLLFANPGNQSVNWTFPYFSGAANLERLFDWQISPSDFEQVRRLSAEEYRQYKHQRTADLIPNTVNNYGYVLVALTSQTIFPFLGDLDGVILLQLMVHLLASLFMLIMVLQTSVQRYGFLLLYAANPLIIYFTTFPFYYFWMFLPSLIFAILILKPEWRQWFVFLAVPILLFSLLIRPTTLFLAGFCFVATFYFACTKAEKWRAIVAALLLVAGVGFLSSQSSGSPWHTMYVGLGAYHNEFGVPDLSDNRGYEYFTGLTGVNIDTNAILGNWNDPEFRRIYAHTLKERYFQIAKENPLILIRNAFFNTLQVFSIGYIADRPLLTWASTTLGFLILVFLLYTRQFVWILSVFASAMGFAWYFPPIPAYNFAAYFLLVIGGIAGLEALIKQRGARILAMG